MVESDHNPLEDIFFDQPSQKMGMTLQRYDVLVRYRKGSEKYIADLYVLDNETDTYWTLRSDPSTCQGVIFKDGRVLVPKRLRKKLLENLHKAHLESAYTLRTSRES